MSITTIVGPMFSGKTTELIRLIDRNVVSKKRCVIIKNLIDNRFDNLDIVCKKTDNNNHVTTHCELTYYKCKVVYLSSLADPDLIQLFTTNYDVVGIDEGFFFEGVVNFCNELANRNVEVIISTLDTDYKQKMFPCVGELMAFSEKVIKLNGICMVCNTDNANFTVRTVKSDKKILVGGKEMYMCVCRKCLKQYAE